MANFDGRPVNPFTPLMNPAATPKLTTMPVPRPPTGFDPSGASEGSDKPNVFGQISQHLPQGNAYGYYDNSPQMSASGAPPPPAPPTALAPVAGGMEDYMLQQELDKRQRQQRGGF